MAAWPLLRSFENEDHFLRRIAYRDHIRRGIVHWRAFRETGPSMSITFQDDELRREAGLDLYQRKHRLLSGDLPGICQLSFFGLTHIIDPPLAPRWDPDESDQDYGHLHCCTDPPSEDQMRRLAKLVMDRQWASLVRHFVQHAGQAE